jgi:Flp pilus assembly pilin Flp
MHLVRAFIQDNLGATAMEYAIIAALVIEGIANVLAGRP